MGCSSGDGCNIATGENGLLSDDAALRITSDLKQTIVLLKIAKISRMYKMNLAALY